MFRVLQAVFKNKVGKWEVWHQDGAEQAPGVPQSGNWWVIPQRRGWNFL
jgi:hypothetical protein